jgi:hypothetical protein
MDQLTTDPPGAGSFDVRRAAVWRGNRYWLIASAAALVAAALVVFSADAPAVLRWLAGLVALGLGAYSIGRVVVGLNSLYRCPNCGTIPYQTVSDYKCGGLGPTRSDFMSPRACPKCGTPLR